MVLYITIGEGGYLATASTTPIGASGIYISNAPDDFIWEHTTCYRYENEVLSFDEARATEQDKRAQDDAQREMAHYQATMLLQGINASLAAKTATIETAILLSPLFPHWQPGKHNEGDSVLDDNYYPWSVRGGQSHDSSNNPDWSPGQAHSLWKPYHGVSAETALPWLDTTLGAYDAGEWMIWSDGERYRCNRDATVWGPDVLPEVWVTE